MNLVIVSGKIISKIEFNFIYDKNKKERHTSIAMCKLELENGNIIDVYGHDEIADYLYRNNTINIFIEGKLNNDMIIEIQSLTTYI